MRPKSLDNRNHLIFAANPTTDRWFYFADRCATAAVAAVEQNAEQNADDDSDSRIFDDVTTSDRSFVAQLTNQANRGQFGRWTANRRAEEHRA